MELGKLSLEDLLSKDGKKLIMNHFDTLDMVNDETRNLVSNQFDELIASISSQQFETKSRTRSLESDIPPHVYAGMKFYTNQWGIVLKIDDGVVKFLMDRGKFEPGDMNNVSGFGTLENNASGVSNSVIRDTFSWAINNTLTRIRTVNMGKGVYLTESYLQMGMAKGVLWSPFLIGVTLQPIVGPVQ